MAINMGYCRFRNTLSALRECKDYLDSNDGSFKLISADEKKALRRLIKACRDLHDEYEYLIDELS